MTFLLDLLSFVLIESKINIFSTIKLKLKEAGNDTYNLYLVDIGFDKILNSRCFEFCDLSS